MKGFRYIVLLAGVLISSLISAQNVSNADFYQDGKTIVLTYSLDKAADVSVLVSTDGGVTYSAPLQHVSGDVGKNVQPGNKRIVWDVLSEYDKLVGDRVMFKLTAGGGKRSFTVKGVTFNMIQVQGGTFTMGATSEQGSDAYDSEKPAHQVTLSDYYIGETEVTQALWEAVMGTTIQQQRNKANSSWGLYGVGSNYPMYYISWNECRDFVQKLSQLTGATFRMPTEAEWEYAARGGNKSRGYKYSGSNNINDVAWYDGNNGSSGSANYGTKPVATKKANELGLYDMSGNVYEWCSDRYGSYSSLAQTNPTGASSGSYRVQRGGNWYYYARHCRVSFRNYDTPGIRDYIIGLRLVLVP